MSHPNQLPKILINGCSHTRAVIPDNPTGAAWPVIFSEMAGVEAINIAIDGKANQQIVEETIRYLINKSDVDHVVIQLNEWKRLNFFRRTSSFNWTPGELETQILPMASSWKVGETDYVKIPAADNRDLRVTRYVDDPQERVYSIGDESYVNNIVTIGTLVNCLHMLCKQRDIGLTIINFHALGDCIADPVWSTIPRERFLVQNCHSGLYNHLLWMFDTPDTFHFEHAAHYKIADWVYDHYIAGKQVKVKKEDFDRTFNNEAERIFDYS